MILLRNLATDSLYNAPRDEGLHIPRIVKEWCSYQSSRTENEGLQCGNCLKIDKFNSHSDSDCILVGEGMLMNIYKPDKEQDSSLPLLEMKFSDAILSIDTGKFIAEAEDRQIIILHPQSYAIYQLNRKDGHTDAGDQNFLTPVIKHALTRRAYTITCGSFGNIRTRDFICIQGLDGSLSFFDQDTVMFTCLFDDIIIPGSVSYIATCDSFAICKSTWTMEIYSYQQLREYSEANGLQKKKNLPQWSYATGEEISSVQVIQTSNNFSTIIILCERHLYCFQDNGLMKNVIRMDFMPLCFNAYLIGWFYEPGARLIIIVTSEDGKLFVYEDSLLLWSCDLLKPVIAIQRCFLKLLPGGLVSLSTDGTVSVSYIGTEPDLNTNLTPIINEPIEPEKIQEQLDIAEVALQKFLKNKEEDDGNYPVVEQIVKVEADVGKPTKCKQFDGTEETAHHTLAAPVVVMLTCKDPTLIQSICITISCCLPFICKDPVIYLENMNGTEIIESHVSLVNAADITDARIQALLTITDAEGKVSVLTRTVLLPLSLFCKPTEVIWENQYKLEIQTNHSCTDLMEIFTDFIKEDFQSHGNSSSIVTLKLNSNKTVTVKASNKSYMVEANNFPEMTSILYYLITKFTEHYTRMGMKDFKYTLNIDGDFKKHLILKYLKCIEFHAKERSTLKILEEQLEVLQKQFTLIQRKLLVQYGSLPPGDCSPLEFLMKDTHERLFKVAHQIISSKETVTKAGNSMTATGSLILNILTQTTEDSFKLKIMHEVFSLNSLYEDDQEWEENATQGLTYFINSVYKKSDRDKEKLAPITEQGILTHINLKRFLKQIRLVLEKMFNDSETKNEDQNKEGIFTRVEEIVEVL